ncbi:hypothetical protein DH2020_033375 [Rehmannia glutinosa]|uniref:Reverse transcriptase n=1 Tax=Rehmannia glutinosa TaxID=99300 RepID=A0ABR0VGE6_REHGL
MARTLKGRYAKYSDFLDAPLGSNPSYIWRSLYWCKSILKKGLCWRVGDGKSIKIFQDCWLPSWKEKLPSTFNSGSSLVRVSELILNGSWNEHLIHNSFLPVVAQEIISLPLPLNQANDSRFWRFNCKGVYTVKDGYRLAIGMFDRPENQSHNRVEHWWKFLWSLNIPTKIRLFWWRISHDFIPTEINLAAHHVPVVGACKMCQYGKDTTTHSMFFCPTMKSYWKSSPFGQTLKKARFGSSLELCMWMHNNLTKSEFEKFAIATWLGWKERQKIIHGSVKVSDITVQTEVSTFLYNFQLARKTQRIGGGDGVEKNHGKWARPPPGCLRLEVDACANETKGQFGIGGIVRNDVGKPVLVFGQKIEHAGSVLELELRAIKEGLAKSISANLFPQLVGSDSLLAVQAVTESKDVEGYIATWAASINLLISMIKDCNIFHISRTTNYCAHSIASFASCNSLPFVWEGESIPHWLEELVCIDLEKNQ